MVHLNQIGNEVIAEKLLEAVAPLLEEKEFSSEKGIAQENKISGRKRNKEEEVFSKTLPPEEEEALLQYIDFLKSVKAECSGGRIGAIVMNCNPFTLGHRYLVEAAAKEVEHLYIFVVEEDSSFFHYKDRFYMVQKGTEEFSNVQFFQAENL